MKDFADSTVVYTKPTCGWCVKAKELLNTKNIPFTEVVLDGQTVTRDTMNQDLGRTDLNTVPQVILRGQFVAGGYTGLSSLLQSSLLQKPSQ